MKRYIKIICINIVLILICLVTLEFGVWYCENKRLVYEKDEYVLKHGFFPFHKGINNYNIDLNNFFTGEENKGRKPVGLQYKNKKPIVIFGCSYAYGFMLNNEQTFSYKLSNLTKRPIYNRAFSSWGSAHVLYQAQSKELYEQVPEPEYVIFLSMHDHFRRLYTMTFMSGDILSETFYLRYKEKNSELIRVRNNNKFFNSLKRLYTFQKIHHFYINNFKLKNKNYENFKFYAKQLCQSKSEMQKHWKNAKFVFIMYDWVKDYQVLSDIMKNNGFEVIYLPDAVKVDLYSQDYVLKKDYHPNEAAWDLITPVIAAELNL